ncbi:MAG: KpsF/GutQ family sugar-phosphate isomerase [Bdellovibrionales bacterium]|nr:KpsF/GutQ family sugar-phosphate isomerase [Bdellovibrionales bacterium]
MAREDIEEGRRVLRVEAEAILAVVERLDDQFAQAVEKVSGCTGKVIVTGIGKSGQIARKIASTMSSTGTPALFVHPAESSHGDLGVIAKDDLVIAISYGGESEEMAAILNYVGRKGISLIAMTGRPESSLGRAAQLVLDISVKEEACPLKLAPTSSSTVSLALGDALAMAVLKRRGFKEADFAEFHPRGSLGRKLLTRVCDVMHTGESVPLVLEDVDMVQVIGQMTSKDVRGVAGVVDSSDKLIGIITDGDIRRRLEKNNKPITEQAKDLMSWAPKTIDANELAVKALFMMEQFQIQTLFVTDRSANNPSKPVGLIHLQDLIRARIS